MGAKRDLSENFKDSLGKLCSDFSYSGVSAFIVLGMWLPFALKQAREDLLHGLGLDGISTEDFLWRVQHIANELVERSDSEIAAILELQQAFGKSSPDVLYLNRKSPSFLSAYLI
ncbi:MAG: hypothetical protein Q8K75_10845 [Chlamydiales bacterium]|nr:hypothetical protein [Chlamydiales bacterium]